MGEISSNPFLGNLCVYRTHYTGETLESAPKTEPGSKNRELLLHRHTVYRQYSADGVEPSAARLAEGAYSRPFPHDSRR